MEKKEWRQITTAQKLQIIQTVDENPNMKRIDIARMMKIPSSRLSTVRRYVCSFNVDENVINQLSKIDTAVHSLLLYSCRIMELSCNRVVVFHYTVGPVSKTPSLLSKACLHLFVLLRVTFGNERTSDCG
ncbi:hypothetical protein T06_10200 [Trichinella sp. T6]|nr:hypothetical protein T06_10200 [Trichinella sp. T6]